MFADLWYHPDRHLSLLRNASCHVLFWSIFFKSIFGGHIHMSYFEATDTPFLFLVTSPLGFKARVGCLIRIAEPNIMYVPWDPPLVLHIANLLTVSICRAPTRFISCPKILLAPVRLEPAIKRSWVLRANHSTTRPGLSSGQFMPVGIRLVTEVCAYIVDLSL